MIINNDQVMGFVVGSASIGTIFLSVILGIILTTLNTLSVQLETLSVQMDTVIAAEAVIKERVIRISLRLEEVVL